MSDGNANGDVGAESGTGPGSSAVLGTATPPAYLLGAVLAAGVVLPGVASFALSRVGYGTLGTAVWALGYAGAVLLVWYVWVRPLDIVGPG